MAAGQRDGGSAHKAQGGAGDGAGMRVAGGPFIKPLGAILPPVSSVLGLYACRIITRP